MGQYYKVVFLTERDGKEVIRLVLHVGKLMEHAYQDNFIMNVVEELISHNGDMYRSRMVWAGDYADAEKDQDMNLYELADEEYKHVRLNISNQPKNKYFRYVVNHSKRLYVDKKRIDQIHPLPLLVSEGNGLGGGDYVGNQEGECGTWARDSISVENEIPEGYKEAVYSFYENE
jgi:hypothetical protein